MNSSHLTSFISDNGIEADILHLSSPTLTVAAAADALGVEPEQIVKSVLFLADGRPALVVASGLARIHRKRLADTLGMSRRRVKMADSEQVQAITGYEVGAVPPFGHLRPLPTLLDEGVLAQETVYGGGGEPNALMRVASEELQRVTGARVVSLAEDAG